MIILLKVFAVYLVLFIARFAGFGIHSAIFDRNVLGGHDEISRVGSDLSLMGLSMFLGSSIIKTQVHSNFTLYLGFFLFLFFLNFIFFLFLKGKKLSMVFCHKAWTPLFVISIILGGLAFRAAIILASGRID